MISRINFLDIISKSSPVLLCEDRSRYHRLRINRIVMQLCGCTARSRYPKISHRGSPEVRKERGNKAIRFAYTQIRHCSYLHTDGHVEIALRVDASARANVNGDGSLGRPATFSDPVPFCSIRRFNRQARSKDCKVMGRGEEAS